MNQTSSEQLLLIQEAGAGLDGAADGERVDLLVASVLSCTRPDPLPVIVRGAVIQEANDSVRVTNRPYRGDADQVDAAIGIEVSRFEHISGDRLLVQHQLTRGIAQPDARALRSSDNQIERAVVVEIRSDKARGGD